jgi:signal transduction histidine kinase
MIADLNEGAPYSISFEVTGDESINLSEQVTLCIFRFFQEAMRNVQKHSLANIVSVKFLIKPEDSFDLTIIDDGQGFVLPEHLGKFAATKHFGLIGIEEQVEAIGGSLLITTAPGKGCRITVRIPFVER